MKATELRDKSSVELKSELLTLHKEQFNLRMQRAAGQLADPSKFKTTRRAIARIKTVLHEKTTPQSHKQTRG